MDCHSDSEFTTSCNFTEQFLSEYIYRQLYWVVLLALEGVSGRLITRGNTDAREHGLQSLFAFPPLSSHIGLPSPPEAFIVPLSDSLLTVHPDIFVPGTQIQPPVVANSQFLHPVHIAVSDPYENGDILGLPEIHITTSRRKPPTYHRKPPTSHHIPTSHYTIPQYGLKSHVTPTTIRDLITPPKPLKPLRPRRPITKSDIYTPTKVQLVDSEEDGYTAQNYDVPKLTFTKEHGLSAVDPHHQYKNDPKYEFSYGVFDPYQGANFGHSERRDGSATVGHYYVNLPDGRLQRVSYYADETGYHPTITYE